MKSEISIILPGIRFNNWEKVYNSILMSTSREFELIICGPYEPSFGIKKLMIEKGNIKFIQDWGSPVRASNIAASLAEGKLITWIADDGVLIPNALDHNIDLLYSKGYEDVVIVAKYYEGNNILQPDEYFKINGSHCTRSKYIDNNWWIFNVAVMHRSYFEYLKGWNCKFEATAMAHTDFAIRAQSDGAKVFMSEYPLLECTHMPGVSGDHGPVHYAQTEHDEKLFQTIYRDPHWDALNTNIIYWKETAPVWDRRFKNYV